MQVKHNGLICDVVFGIYTNGNIAIQLFGSEGTKYEGELVSVATVNGEELLGRNVVGIKDWSENEGMVDSLIESNVIKDELLGLEPSGFVAIFHYELTDQAIVERNKQIEDIFDRDGMGREDY